jgi:hypothetical protein
MSKANTHVLHEARLLTAPHSSSRFCLRGVTYILVLAIEAIARKPSGDRSTCNRCDYSYISTINKVSNEIHSLPNLVLRASMSWNSACTASSMKRKKSLQYGTECILSHKKCLLHVITE